MGVQHYGSMSMSGLHGNGMSVLFMSAVRLHGGMTSQYQYGIISSKAAMTCH